MKPLFLFLMLVMVGAVAPAQNKSYVNLGAFLNGAQVVPPSSSTATGNATFTLDLQTRQIHYRINTNNSLPVTARICRAPAGQNGPCPFTLNLSTGSTIITGTTLALSDTEAYALLGGHTYVELRAGSTTILRGQISPVSQRVFEGTLDGSQMFPPTASPLQGTFRLALDEPSNTVSYDVHVPGAAGLVTQLLSGAGGPAGTIITTLVGTQDRWRGRTQRLSPSQVSELKTGQTFLRVFTQGFPGGEVQGTIAPATGQGFVCFLRPEETLPMPSGSSASGFVSLSFDDASSTLTYDISLTNTVASAVNLSAGYAGQAIGPVPMPGNGTQISGSMPIKPLGARLLYVQGLNITVISPGFPQGELRGQIVPNPIPFGYPSQSATGPVEIGFKSQPTVGNPAWTVTLGGVPANSAAYLFLTFTNETWLGLPLPMPIGSGFLFNRPVNWIDSAATNFFNFPLVADGQGFAEVPIPIPNDPILHRLHSYYQWVSASGSQGTTISASAGLRVIVP